MEHGLTYFCFNYYFVSISLDQSTQEGSQAKSCVCLCVCLTTHLQCECLWGYGFDGLQSTCPRPTHNISSVFLDIVSVLLVGLNGKGKRNVWLTFTSAWVTRDVDLLIPLPITVSLESLWLKLQYLKMCVCLSSYDCCPDVRGPCHICLNWGWFKSPSGRDTCNTQNFPKQKLFGGVQDTHTSASVTVPHTTEPERIKIYTDSFWNSLN